MITASDLYQNLRRAREAQTAADELALVDIREPGEFKAGHLLLASNLPLSRLEWLAPRLLPRLDLRIVIGADHPEDPRVARAVAALRAWGYQAVDTLGEDFATCERAGFVIFTGFNVPSKTFGEWLERRRHTPHIAPRALAEQLTGTHPPCILDCRPADEHQAGTLPHSLHLPGVELARRAASVVGSEDRPIVVHCAGRTRGIVATQALIDLGYPNPVQVLENGLMGWQLAGQTVSQPSEPPSLPPLAPLEDSWRRRAMALAERSGAQRWQASDSNDQPEGTTLGFTVGTADEARHSCPLGFAHVPGGQLLQSLDDQVAVHGARIVIHATDTLRAALTAAYLKQMGWQRVSWLADDLAGPAAPPVTAQKPQIASTCPAEARMTALELALDPTTWVLDLGNSRRYRDHHLPGAQFVIRARLPELLSEQPPPTHARRILLTCDDGELSLAAWSDVAKHTSLPVQVLADGVSAWVALGKPLGAEPQPLCPYHDVPTTPYDAQEDLETQMQAYIAWELKLEEQVARDGILRFRDVSP